MGAASAPARQSQMSLLLWALAAVAAILTAMPSRSVAASALRQRIREPASTAVSGLRARARQPALLAILAGALLSLAVGLEMVRLETTQRDLKAVLILIAVAALLIGALRPRIGLAMMLALIPFDYHFSGTGTDEVLLVTMALLLAWRIRWAAVPRWAAAGGIALVLGSFIAAIDAHNQLVALWGGVRWLAAMILMFVAFGLFRRRSEASRRMADIFTGSAVVVVLFAFAQKAGIDVIVSAPFAAGLPNSFFAYYTNYGGYAAMAAIVASGGLLAAVSARERRRTVLYGAALVLIIAGLAISLSRGALLSLGAGWIVMIILNLRRGRLVFQAIAVLAVFAAAGFLATPESTVRRIEQRFSAPLGTLAEDRERFAIQELGEHALADHPFGIGYANFSYYALAHKRSSVHENFQHAQNTPIQIGLDAGWIGLAGFMLLFLMPVGLTLMRRERDPATIRASGFAAALCGFMAQGMFDYLFFELAFVVFYAALVWGTAQALRESRRTAPSQATTTAPAPTITASGLASGAAG